MTGKKEVIKIDHNKVVYQPFRKNFWVEVPELKAMSNKEVEAYRAVSNYIHNTCNQTTPHRFLNLVLLLLFANVLKVNRTKVRRCGFLYFVSVVYFSYCFPLSSICVFVNRWGC